MPLFDAVAPTFEAQHPQYVYYALVVGEEFLIQIKTGQHCYGFGELGTLLDGAAIWTTYCRDR